MNRKWPLSQLFWSLLGYQATNICWQEQLFRKNCNWYLLWEKLTWVITHKKGLWNLLAAPFKVFNNPSSSFHITWSLLRDKKNVISLFEACSNKFKLFKLSSNIAPTFFWFSKMFNHRNEIWLVLALMLKPFYGLRPTSTFAQHPSNFFCCF